MTKRQKAFAGLDVLTKNIIDQQQRILALTELKNSVILCSRQYEQDIADLKRCINDFKTAIRSNTKLHTHFPLSTDGKGKNGDFPFIEFTTIKQITPNEVICSAEYSPDGNFFAFASFLTLFLYDASSFECKHNISLPFDPGLAYERVTRTVRFSKDSKYLAVCAADFSVFVFQVPSLNHVSTVQKNSACAASITFFNNSSKMLTSGARGTINVYTIPTFQLAKTVVFNENSPIVSILISSDDSTVLVLNADGSIGIFDSSFNQQPNIVSTDTSFMYSAALSKSSTFLAIASREKEVKVFSLVGGFKLEKTLEGHTDYVVCVSFSPDGKVVFTGSKDETVRAWDLETSSSLGIFGSHSNTVFNIAHHPDKNMFITCSGDGSLCIVQYKVMK